MIKSVGYPLVYNTRYKLNIIDNNVKEALPDLERIFSYFDIPFELFNTKKEMILNKNSNLPIKVLVKKDSLNIFFNTLCVTKPKAQANKFQISTSGDIYKFTKNELKPQLQNTVSEHL